VQGVPQTGNPCGASIPWHAADGTCELQGSSHQLDRLHVAVWLSPLPIHGRDSTVPEVVDTGVGDQEVIPLLDPHGLVIDPHLNRGFIGPNRPPSVPRAGSAPGPAVCRSRPLGRPRRNPALTAGWA
jgi:hypothetical protein